jgi:hypothetical protein
LFLSKGEKPDASTGMLVHDDNGVYSAVAYPDPPSSVGDEEPVANGIPRGFKTFQNKTYVDVKDGLAPQTSASPQPPTGFPGQANDDTHVPAATTPEEAPRIPAVAAESGSAAGTL